MHALGFRVTASYNIYRPEGKVMAREPSERPYRYHYKERQQCSNNEKQQSYRLQLEDLACNKQRY